jgi:hypothetical protein
VAGSGRCQRRIARPGACAIGLLIVGVATTLGYMVVGHTVIDVLYEGSTGTRLDRIIAGQHSHPIEHYYAFADRQVPSTSVSLGLFAWGLLSLSLASSTWALLLLLSTDAFFILFECLYGATAGYPESDWWLGRDWGYAESFQYAKELGIVVFFFRFFRGYPHLLSLGWLVLFLYLLLDDSLQIHEGVGRWVAPRLHTSWEFTDHVASALFGSLILGLLSLGYYCAPAWLRRVSWPLLGLFMTLVVFGVVVDTVGQVVHRSAPLIHWVGYVIEEAGEMVTISVIAWYVHRLATNWSRPVLATFRCELDRARPVLLRAARSAPGRNA